MSKSKIALSTAGEDLASLLRMAEEVPSHPLIEFAESLKNNTLSEVSELRSLILERKKFAKIVQKAHGRLNVQFLSEYKTQRGPTLKEVPWAARFEEQAKAPRKVIHQDPRFHEFHFRVKYLRIVVSYLESQYLILDKARALLSHGATHDVLMKQDILQNRERQLVDKQIKPFLEYFGCSDRVTITGVLDKLSIKFGSLEKISELCESELSDIKEEVQQRYGRIKPIKWVEKDLYKPHCIHNMDGSSILKKNGELCTWKTATIEGKVRRVWIRYADLCDLIGVPQECFLTKCDVHGKK
jgi:hypothetical protein